eukprot:Gb_17474 [translate_table: standard]
MTRGLPPSPTPRGEFNFRQMEVSFGNNPPNMHKPTAPSSIAGFALNSIRCQDHKLYRGSSAPLIYFIGVQRDNHCKVRRKERCEFLFYRHKRGKILDCKKQSQGQLKEYQVELPKRDCFLQWLEVALDMGGEPVTTEPAVLIVDEEVRSIMEKAGLLSFFKNFRGHSESITNQFIESWKGGKVVVDKTEILINAALIAEVSSLPNDGKAGKGKSPLHQGLMKMIVDFISNKKSSATVSSHIDSGDADSEDEGDSKSLEKDNLAKIPKDKGYKKRKPLAQVLSASLAKCSRRSSRLQRKSVGNSTPVDVTENSEEERKSNDPSRLGGKSSPQKGSTAAPSRRDKSPGDPLLLSEDLRCHFKVLNGLGASLSSTCACVNLLTLEITKYLKEVLKYMKERNVEKE